MNEIKDYIRVTDVLFPFSGLKSIDPLILQRAAERGTKVHEIIEAIIEGLGTPVITPDVDGYITSFQKWMPKKFVQKPERFFCNDLMLTGECDGIYDDEEGDGLVLVDFKTPVNESKTWRLQGSAYAYLARKAGYEIKRIEFVKLSKTGSAPKVYIYEEDFEMYLKCLDVYKMFYKNVQEENPLDYI